jgi:hypothetical protein
MEEADHPSRDPLAALAAAARVLAEHPDSGVRAIADWLGSGARGDLRRCLASPRRDDALARRNAALRAAARILGDDLSLSERARMVALAARRYRAAGWRHDRVKPVCPHPAGSLRAALFAALRAVDRDLSCRTLRRILGDSEVEVGHRFDDRMASLRE